jgi:hypothetical protein
VPTRFSGPRPPGGEDFSRFAKVSVDDLGLVVAGQHDFAVRDRDRVDLDIRHPAVPGGRLGDLVHVSLGRDPGADVEELPDPSPQPEIVDVGRATVTGPFWRRI